MSYISPPQRYIIPLFNTLLNTINPYVTQSTTPYQIQIQQLTSYLQLLPKSINLLDSIEHTDTSQRLDIISLSLLTKQSLQWIQTLLLHQYRYNSELLSQSELKLTKGITSNATFILRAIMTYYPSLIGLTMCVLYQSNYDLFDQQSSNPFNQSSIISYERTQISTRNSLLGYWIPTYKEYDYHFALKLTTLYSFQSSHQYALCGTIDNALRHGQYRIPSGQPLNMIGIEPNYQHLHLPLHSSNTITKVYAPQLPLCDQYSISNSAISQVLSPNVFHLHIDVEEDLKLVLADITKSTEMTHATSCQLFHNPTPAPITSKVIDLYTVPISSLHIYNMVYAGLLPQFLNPQYYLTHIGKLSKQDKAIITYYPFLFQYQLPIFQLYDFSHPSFTQFEIMGQDQFSFITNAHRIIDKDPTNNTIYNTLRFTPLTQQQLQLNDSSTSSQRPFQGFLSTNGIASIHISNLEQRYRKQYELVQKWAQLQKIMTLSPNELTSIDQTILPQYCSTPFFRYHPIPLLSDNNVQLFPLLDLFLSFYTTTYNSYLSLDANPTSLRLSTFGSINGQYIPSTVLLQHIAIFLQRFEQNSVFHSIYNKICLAVAASSSVIQYAQIKTLVDTIRNDIIPQYPSCYYNHTSSIPTSSTTHGHFITPFIIWCLVSLLPIHDNVIVPYFFNTLPYRYLEHNDTTYSTGVVIKSYMKDYIYYHNESIAPSEGQGQQEEEQQEQQQLLSQSNDTENDELNMIVSIEIIPPSDWKQFPDLHDLTTSMTQFLSDLISYPSNYGLYQPDKLFHNRLNDKTNDGDDNNNDENDEIGEEVSDVGISSPEGQQEDNNGTADNHTNNNSKMVSNGKEDEIVENHHYHHDQRFAPIEAENHYSLLSYLIAHHYLFDYDLFLTLLTNTQQFELTTPISYFNHCIDEMSSLQHSKRTLEHTYEQLFMTSTFYNYNDDMKKSKNCKRYKNQQKNRIMNQRHYSIPFFGEKPNRAPQTLFQHSQTSIFDPIRDNNHTNDQQQQQAPPIKSYLLSILILRRYPAKILSYFLNLPINWDYHDDYGLTILDYCLLSNTYNYAPDFVLQIISKTTTDLTNVDYLMARYNVLHSIYSFRCRLNPELSKFNIAVNYSHIFYSYLMVYLMFLPADVDISLQLIEAIIKKQLHDQNEHKMEYYDNNNGTIVKIDTNGKIIVVSNDQSTQQQPASIPTSSISNNNSIDLVNSGFFPYQFILFLLQCDNITLKPSNQQILVNMLKQYLPTRYTTRIIAPTTTLVDENNDTEQNVVDSTIVVKEEKGDKKDNKKDKKDNKKDTKDNKKDKKDNKKDGKDKKDKKVKHDNKDDSTTITTTTTRTTTPTSITKSTSTKYNYLLSNPDCVEDDLKLTLFTSNHHQSNILQSSSPNQQQQPIEIPLLPTSNELIAPIKQTTFPLSISNYLQFITSTPSDLPQTQLNQQNYKYQQYTPVTSFPTVFDRIYMIYTLIEANCTDLTSFLQSIPLTFSYHLQFFYNLPQHLLSKLLLQSSNPNDDVYQPMKSILQVSNFDNRSTTQNAHKFQSTQSFYIPKDPEFNNIYPLLGNYVNNCRVIGKIPFSTHLLYNIPYYFSQSLYGPRYNATSNLWYTYIQPSIMKCYSKFISLQQQLIKIEYLESIKGNATQFPTKYDIPGQIGIENSFYSVLQSNIDLLYNVLQQNPNLATTNPKYDELLTQYKPQNEPIPQVSKKENIIRSILKVVDDYNKIRTYATIHSINESPALHNYTASYTTYTSSNYHGDSAIDITPPIDFFQYTHHYSIDKTTSYKPIEYQRVIRGNEVAHQFIGKIKQHVERNGVCINPSLYSTKKVENDISSSSSDSDDDLFSLFGPCTGVSSGSSKKKKNDDNTPKSLQYEYSNIYNEKNKVYNNNIKKDSKKDSKKDHKHNDKKYNKSDKHNKSKLDKLELEQNINKFQQESNLNYYEQSPLSDLHLILNNTSPTLFDLILKKPNYLYYFNTLITETSALSFIPIHQRDQSLNLSGSSYFAHLIEHMTYDHYVFSTSFFRWFTLHVPYDMNFTTTRPEGMTYRALFHNIIEKIFPVILPPTETKCSNSNTTTPVTSPIKNSNTTSLSSSTIHPVESILPLSQSNTIHTNVHRKNIIQLITQYSNQFESKLDDKLIGMLRHLDHKYFTGETIPRPYSYYSWNTPRKTTASTYCINTNILDVLFGNYDDMNNSNTNKNANNNKNNNNNSKVTPTNNTNKNITYNYNIQITPDTIEKYRAQLLTMSVQKQIKTMDEASASSSVVTTTNTTNKTNNGQTKIVKSVNQQHKNLTRDETTYYGDDSNDDDDDENDVYDDYDEDYYYEGENEGDYDYYGNEGEYDENFESPIGVDECSDDDNYE